MRGIRSDIAVSLWMEDQEWFDAWNDNLVLQVEDDDLRIWYAEGHEGVETIKNSIIWYLTPEGYDYWREIDKQFRKWYYGD